MWIRRLHRGVGLVLAPFFLLTAVAGGLLLWRAEGIYSFEIRKLLMGLHNWEEFSDYIGVILAAGLAWMAISGVALRAQMWRRKRAARRRQGN